MTPPPFGYVTRREAEHLPARRCIRLFAEKPAALPCVPVYDAEGMDSMFKAAIAIVTRMLRVHENRDAETAETLARQMLRAQLGDRP